MEDFRNLKDDFPQFSETLIHEIQRLNGKKARRFLEMLAKETDIGSPSGESSKCSENDDLIPLAHPETQTDTTQKIPLRNEEGSSNKESVHESHSIKMPKSQSTKSGCPMVILGEDLFESASCPGDYEIQSEREFYFDEDIRRYGLDDLFQMPIEDHEIYKEAKIEPSLGQNRANRIESTPPSWPLSESSEMWHTHSESPSKKTPIYSSGTNEGGCSFKDDDQRFDEGDDESRIDGRPSDWGSLSIEFSETSHKYTLDPSCDKESIHSSHKFYEEENDIEITTKKEEPDSELNYCEETTFSFSQPILDDDPALSFFQPVADEDTLILSFSELIIEEDTTTHVSEPLNLDTEYYSFLEKSLRNCTIQEESSIAINDEPSPDDWMGLPPGIELESDEEDHQIPMDIDEPPPCLTQTSEESTPSIPCSSLNACMTPHKSDQLLKLHISARMSIYKKQHDLYFKLMLEAIKVSKTLISREIHVWMDRRLRGYVAQNSWSKRQVRQQTYFIRKVIDEAQDEKQRLYAIGRLAHFFIVSCRNNNVKMNAALANVVRNISKKHPELIKLIMASLYKANPLLVPMYWTCENDSEEARIAFEAKMMYPKCPDRTIERWKIDEEYHTLQSCLVSFYAALISIQPNRKHYGIDAGWTYLASFVNNIPVERTTILFLYVFLSIAGNALYEKYKRQFLKVLKVIEKKYIIETTAEEDEAGAVSRLKTYLSKQHYLNPPECFVMPEIAESMTISV